MDLNVLVLGIGNILLSDEGAGIRAIEDLQKRYTIPQEVGVIDGGTMGLDLLPYLDNLSHLFIVDAVRSEKPPGTPSRIPLDDPPAYFRTKITPHQLGLSELLAVASITDSLPGDIVLFGIEPEKLDPSLEMSTAVEKSIAPLADMIAAELEQVGFSLQEVA